MLATLILCSNDLQIGADKRSDLILIFLATRKFFRSRENFGKKRLGRRDRFRPKIVEIGAILAIFEPFEV